MSVIDPSEVKRGLVVHTDTALLRAIGGSSTNAEVSGESDRAVFGPHYFVVLEVADGEALAVPLFSQRAPGSEPLTEQLKGGLPDKWIGETSYFSRWQHWRIPIAALAAASGNEESDATARRTYAVESPATLESMAGWAAKNRASWRPI